MQKYSLGIMGSGARWLALAHILQQNWHIVTIWEHNFEDCQYLDKKRTTPKIPNFKISENLIFTNSIDDILDCSIIINAIPTQYIRKILQSTKPNIRKEKIIINAAKWIELKTGNMIHQIFEEETELLLKNYFSFSGASFANEICNKNAYTHFILASNDQENYAIVKSIFENDFCHIDGSNDIIWVEVSGALKNIYAIGAGILDGMNISINTKAIFLLKSLEEIQKIGMFFWAKKSTFCLSCGLGDLYISCESPLSRNWQVGNRLGKGEELKKILSSMNMISEWTSTVKIIYEMGKKNNLNIPICTSIYQYLYWKKNIEDILKSLHNI